MDRVLVGLDSSLLAPFVLGQAVLEANSRGRVLEIVHALHAKPHGHAANFGQDCDVCRGSVAAADSLVEEAKRVALASGVVEVLGGVIIDDDPRRALVVLAKPADVLVVGTGQRHGLKGLGSVSRYCAEHAPCPVLLVPMPSHLAPTGN